MPLTLLGSEFEACERGAYSPTEADDIRKFCHLMLPPAPEPQDPLDKAVDFLDGMARLGAMTFLCRYLASPRNASAIDPRVRLLTYFSKHNWGPVCAASSRPMRLMPPDRPTYVVAFHAEGVPVLRQRINAVSVALRAGVSILPLEPYSRLLDSDLPEHEPLMLAVLFVFFHEFGHVIGGHLDWQPALDAPPASLGPDQRLERRALEIHADGFAAMLLGKALATLAASDTVPTAQDRDAKWLVIGLLAVYAVCTALAESGEAQSACYHSPYVRLLHANLWLARGLGLDKKSAEWAVAALSDRLFGTNEAECARGNGFGAGAGDKASSDSKELDDITMPLLKRLVREGRLRGRITEEET